MNYKQQKRIKDTALMVRNVLNMSDNMQKINLNYAADLEEFINKLKNISVAGANAPAANSTADKPSGSEIILIEPKSSGPAEEPEEQADNPSSSSRPQKTKKPPPPWSKDLYRKIMKKCHPDKNVNVVLPPEEQIYRAEALHIAIESYKEESFDKLIYAGALVDEYSQRISATKQVAILNRCYSENSQQISGIQSSISWSWGINWDTIESRIQLVHRLCLINKIKPVSKEELIVLLTEHEMK